MAQELIPICSLLVEEACGDAPAKVFSTLASRGRLTLDELGLTLDFKGQQLDHALATLVQHHLLHHYTPKFQSTIYEVNWLNAYSLLRSGRIVSIVSLRYGAGAGMILRNLLQLGHVKVADLLDCMEFPVASPADTGGDVPATQANGQNLDNETTPAQVKSVKGASVTTIAQLHQTLRILLRDKFLVPVGPSAYTSNADLKEYFEDLTLEKPSDRPTSGKKWRMFNHQVAQLQRARRKEEEYSEPHHVTSSNPAKRGGGSANTEQPHPKRIKLGQATTNGLTSTSVIENEEDTERRVSIRVGSIPKSGVSLANIGDNQHDLVVRVNHQKCLVAIRTERLRKLVSLHLGDACVVVYTALLHTLEAKVRTVRDDPEKYDDAEEEEGAQPTSSAAEVVRALPPDVDLDSLVKGTGTHTSNNRKHRGRKDQYADEPDGVPEANMDVKIEISDDDDDGSVQAHKQNGYTSYRDRTSRVAVVESLLEALQEHQFEFCDKFVGVDGQCKWRVNFPRLIQTLIDTELYNIVLSRFGRTSARVIRMLREKGMMDEKQLAQASLMRQKGVRAVLTNLQQHGFLHHQELPKDNTRQPSRTLYLWRYDSQRVEQKVLYDCHLTITRCLLRMRVERQGRFKSVIDKAERMDVKGNESTMLTPMEHEMLRKWTEVETRLLVQIQRCDDTVAVVRDYSGKSTWMST